MEGQKKWSCFRISAGSKFFYHSSARIVECVSEYIFLISQNQKDRTRRQKKAKETKEENRISLENLTGYSDIVCELALCTFNLLDRVVNFSWLYI